MRTRRISTATSLAVLFSSVVLVGGAANPAAADSSKILPAASVGDIVTDGVHKRVFISDPTGGKVLVTDYAGAVVATLPSLPGVTGLDLSADSGTVYAAVPGADAIVAIDTAALTESARYETGIGTGPKYPALAGGKLWFGYGPTGAGHIGSLDLTSPEPVVNVDQEAAGTWYLAPTLASTPGAPGVLAAGVESQSPTELATYDVTSGTATRTASTFAGANLRDLALSPDGTQLVVASGSPYKHQVYRTSDLTPDIAYPSDAYPNAVDIAPDGTVAAGIDGAYQPDVYVYKQGVTSKPVRTYDFPDTGDGVGILDPAGLAWAPDTSRLFAVTMDNYGLRSLRVLTDPNRSVTTVTVDAPEKTKRGKKLMVTGRAESNAPFAAGATATVTRTDLESPAGKVLPPVELKPDGAFHFVDTPPAGSTVTYKVSYAGDATHSPGSGSDKVAVSRAASSLTLNRNKGLYAYGTDVSFTAHLGTTYKNRAVELWVDPFGLDRPKKLAKTGTVDSKGNLSTTVDMTRDTTVTAVFKGDARYASKTVTSTAYAKVAVSTTISKQYKTVKIGSTSYAYFHKTTNPVFTTKMTFYKNRSHLLSLELYYGGKWYDAGSQYFPLGTAGSIVTLTGTHETGYRMRVRASYVNDASGDNVNSTTHGAWKYFYFTK
ncbi:Ig-like domain repeat protein [Streptomyces sp. NBC_01022]|uniref:Ig-like domain repeat protein n=1 Tax=Streptomyces sp. NBC_01022 TaxID=2903723 RepID=UPI002DDA82DD|nr:Ig-like domain repeat protein [Streptomyces sp. NBC_01022]WRZ82763.1 Ig-like domain repeat protein [Streptomyces sp. NBC_01022]